MTLIERCAWWCPVCRWTASYAEPMTDVFCVRCMHEGRGTDQRCEKFVPVDQLRGAVEAGDALKAAVVDTMADMRAQTETKERLWAAVEAYHDARGQ